MIYRLIPLLLLLMAGDAPAVDRTKSQEFFEQAMRHYRESELPEAAIQLRNALQQNPENLPARVMLGQVMLYQDQPRAAIKELERALAMGGDENLILIPLASAYMEVVEPEKVITGILAEGHSPEVDGQLHLLKAQAYLQLGDTRQAEEHYLNAGTLMPVNPGPLLGRAQLQLAKGRADKARRILDEAIALAPDSFDAWFFKATMDRDRRQFKDAIEAFEKALEIDPLSGRALTARAAMWLDLGQVDKAREDLVAVSDLNVDTLEAIYLRTLLMFREGRGEEAREELRASADDIRAIAEGYRSKLPNTMLMLGVVAFFEENYDEAVSHLTSFLSKIPNHPGAKRYLAGAYLSLGEFREVVKIYRPSVRSEPPRDPMALSILAEAYRGLGDYAASEKYLETALAIAPNIAGIGVRLATSRLDAGQAEAAVEQLEKLVERFPQLSDAWVQLARVHVKIGNPTRAKELVGDMLERFNGDPLIHNVAGATYLAAGDAEAARLQIRLAAELDPDLILPQINLARLARVEGSPERAEAQYRKTLERFPHNTTANLELVELLLLAGEADEATDRINAVLQREPHAFRAHELKLRALAQQRNDPDRLRSALFELTKAFPEEPRADLVAGRNFRRIGEIADARVHFRRAVEKARFDTEVLFEVANQQYGIGDRSGALWTLTKAEQASPDHLGVGVLKAAVLVELDEFDKARAMIDALRERHGGRAEILTVEGDLLMAQGKRAEGAEAYRVAFEMLPNERTVKTHFRALVAAGEIDDATAVMENWMAGNPDDLGARHLYAQMLMKEKRWNAAVAIYESLQSSGVEDIILLNNLAVAYQHLDDPRALPTAEAAHNRAPNDPSVIDTYGWILTENDRLEEGLALLRDAYARASTSPAIRYHIGLALARLGRTDEAREEVEAALAASDAFPARDEAAGLLERLRGGD